MLWDEFQALLDAEKTEGECNVAIRCSQMPLSSNHRHTDLRRMYSLLFRIPEGLEPLRAKFETHVKRVGMDAVEKIAGTGAEAVVSSA